MKLIHKAQWSSHGRVILSHQMNLSKKFIDIHFILCLKRQKYPFDYFRSCFDLASSLTIPIDVIRDSDLMDPNEQSFS